VSCRIAAALLERSEGIDSFESECLMRIRLLELEMVRPFQSTAKDFALVLCYDMPEGMIEWTENTKEMQQERIPQIQPLCEMIREMQRRDDHPSM
jgi:hypothetical protein